MPRPPCLTELSRKAAEHGALRARAPAEVLSVVPESGFPVGCQACGVRLIDGKYDAGLSACVPRGQFRGGCHRRCRCKRSQSLALPPPVDEEPTQQPGGMVIRPAGQAGRPCLQRQHPDGFPCRFDHIRPARLLRQAGQGHPQRIAGKCELPGCQLQEGDGSQLDGARIRFQVVQGNEPDGLDCGSQLAGDSVLPAGVSPAGGPAGSIHMTSHR